VSVSPLWGFPALFGPALADVRAGMKDLLGRVVRWRVGAGWYAVAFGLPAVLALAAAGLHLLLGAGSSIEFGGMSVLNLVVFVLIVGEERGYALPKLLAGRSALSASLILGVLWGAWHLPAFFVPGAPQHGLLFSALVMLTVAYSVVFTWVYLHTHGSVLIAGLMHGAINLFQGLLLGGIDPAREYWLLAAVYGVAVLALLAAAGLNLYRKSGVPAEAPIGSGPPGKETPGRL
jgi:hypothetical protein